MFNQKLHSQWSENAPSLNGAYGAPYISALDAHRCGTTIDKYKKVEPCGGIPLQTWCEPNVSVNSFAMRPIVNSKEYFENIKKYLASIIYTDSIALKQSGLKSEQYTLIDAFAQEPDNSFLQAIELSVVELLTYYMGESANQISMFKNYNPLCEGFIINDIDIKTYQSKTNGNHFLHRVVFAAVNTTRYNTISFKSDVYQDTSPMINNWNSAIRQVQSSKTVTPSTSDATSNIYIGTLDLLNNTTCVLGQESECDFKGHNLSGTFANLLNENNFASNQVSWLTYPSLADTIYTAEGNYDSEGKIKIVDQGPSNLESLLKSFMN